jgi:HAD superfamily hydrolase (TIGR01509 family)
MTVPKAVVFDLGKVLLDFDYGIAIARIQKQCRLSIAELQTLINQSPLLHRYETNLITTAQFFTEVQAASDFRGGLDEFRAMFADIFTPIEPMVRLHQQLHTQGKATYLFSNTNEIAMQHILERFPFVRQFDGHILSFEHNAMKPDPALYAVVERISGQQGSDLLYIDDRAENVDAGQVRGWRVILHGTPDNTIAAVRKTGLLSSVPL